MWPEQQHRPRARRYAFSRHIDGRVHDPAVNVAEFLEAKEPRAVGRVIEGEGLVFVSSSMVSANVSIGQLHIRVVA